MRESTSATGAEEVDMNETHHQTVNIEAMKSLILRQQEEIRSCNRSIVEINELLENTEGRLKYALETSVSLARANERLTDELEKIKGQLKSIHGDVNKTRDTITTKMDKITEEVAKIGTQRPANPEVTIERRAPSTSRTGVPEGITATAELPMIGTETAESQLRNYTSEEPFRVVDYSKNRPQSQLKYDLDLLIVGDSNVRGFEVDKIYQAKQVEIKCLDKKKKNILGAQEYLAQYQKSPRIILLQVAANSLADSDSAERCIVEYHDLLKMCITKFPHSKIVHSEVLPRLVDGHMATKFYFDKMHKFNSLIHNDIIQDPALIVQHPWLRDPRSGHFRGDGLHLNYTGIRQFVRDMKATINPLLGMPSYVSVNILIAKNRATPPPPPRRPGLLGDGPRDAGHNLHPHSRTQNFDHRPSGISYANVAWPDRERYQIFHTRLARLKAEFGF